MLAIGELLSERLDARVEAIRLQIRHKHLARIFSRLLPLGRRLGFKQSRWLRKFIFPLLFSGTYPGDTRPLAAISTLGRGEAQGAFIACFWQVPAVHLGSPKQLSSKHFSAVITHPCDVARNKEIPLALAPTRMRLRRDYRTAGEMPTFRKICLLLGGGTKGGMHYHRDFWSRCVTAAIETARAQNAALLISTSPRSGRLVEDLVEATVSQSVMPECECILYGRGDRCDLTAELTKTDAVLVTAESISMMSDAIASGAYVLALYDVTLPVSLRAQRFLKTHSAANTLKLVDLSEWNADALSFDGLTPLTSCWSEMLWERLAPLFVESTMQKGRWKLINPAATPSS